MVKIASFTNRESVHLGKRGKWKHDWVRRNMRILLEMVNNRPMPAQVIAKYLNCSTRYIATYVKRWPEFAWIIKRQLRLYYLKGGDKLDTS